MLEGVIFLQSFRYFNIGDLLYEWESFGVFTYVLPFLLIFALVYGILSSMQIFKENRAVDGIIALTVGLMALQFDFVPSFFSEIFPRLGIALSIILVFLILAGFFINPKNSGIMYTLLGLATIVAVVVLVNTSNALYWTSGSWWADNWPVIVFLIFMIAAIALIMVPRQHKPQDYELSLWRPHGASNK